MRLSVHTWKYFQCSELCRRMTVANTRLLQNLKNTKKATSHLSGENIVRDQVLYQSKESKFIFIDVLYFSVATTP